MNRRKFFKITGGTILAAGGIFYLLSDKRNFIRSDVKDEPVSDITPRPDEHEILYLASLAPSGHNTQPWFVKYIEPYHWIIGNDKRKWLPAVDPSHRETILSIGAFMQNLEYAASHWGYVCRWNVIAATNEDENIAEVRLIKTGSVPGYDISRIKRRRTLRNGYFDAALRKADLAYLLADDLHFFYFPNTSKEYRWLNEQTIEANRIQAYRDDAQKELAEWIRFSSKDAQSYRDGLTTAGMEMEGMTGWVVRNFFRKSSALKNSFREKGIDRVKEQVSHSGGWIIITSNDNAVADLIETGKLMQRLFLKVRDKGIGLHPMTQILEESPATDPVNQSTGINGKIQFLLRTGYVKNYPDPVSLRRPVKWFLRV
ncbi:nitroreductase [Niastella populi]|uniref:Nitroreductase n=2 Tax=Niastella populi TaxID=550983 RepID=A0A1V9F283_9BACT|nr:nitroreductase [Niastella populi]